MKTEWVHKKLGECCNSELGKTLDEGRNTGSFRPYLCALNVLWGKIDLSTIKQMRIEEEERERYLVKKGDLLVCEGGEIGRCAIWESDDEIYYQNALHRVRFCMEYDARFFMYLLCHYNDLKLIEKYGKGLTIKHLNQAAFRNIPVCVPDLLAQRRIAAILSSADKVIDTTRRLIGKYKQMKQGMMEDLLKPKEGWKMVKLGDCCDIITGPFGSSLHEKDYTKDGIPVINPQNIVNHRIIAIDGCLVNDETVERLGKFKLKIGDIVIARRGEMGRCAVVDVNQEGWLCGTGCFAIKVHHERVNAHFLQLQLCSESTKVVLENNSIGATMSNLNQSILCELEIGVPSLAEQRRIAAILSGIDAKIAAEEKVLEKYEKVKKGLMERMLNATINKSNNKI